jgi:hypothetical protein
MSVAHEIEFLTAAELHALTGYARAAEQEAWLKQHSMPCLRDGKRVVVSRVHVRERLAGREIVSSSGPNWDALNA